MKVYSYFRGLSLLIPIPLSGSLFVISRESMGLIVLVDQDYKLLIFLLMGSLRNPGQFMHVITTLCKKNVTI